MEEPVLSTLDNLLHQLYCVQSDLKSLPTNSGGSEMSPQFWSKLKSNGQLISKRATNFCMLFGKPPYPSLRGSEVPCLELQVACQAICEIFKTLPKASGETLWNRTHEMVSSINSALIALVVSVKSSPNQVTKPLTTTGTVWEYCDQLSSLPEDNKSAVLEELGKLSNLVSDALSELDELIKSTGNAEAISEESEDGETAAQWSSDADKILLNSCLGLTKAAKATLKNLTEWIKDAGGDGQQSIADMDGLVVVAGEVSPAVDDLICSLYDGPTNKDAILTEAAKLRDVLLKLLLQYSESQLFQPGQNERLQFLQTAVEHNYNKLVAE